MTINVRIAIVVAVQTLLLAGMIGVKQYTLSTGTPILLETRPVDPRSLFRGDHVQLHYSISTLRVAQLEGDREYRVGDPIFVSLQQQGKYWQAVASHRHRPEPLDTQLVIRGRVVEVQDVDSKAMRDGEVAPNEVAAVPEARRAVEVRYLIEDYFVPEGEGRALESMAFDRIDIRVAVDRYGRAGILAVLVDGEEYYAESLF